MMDGQNLPTHGESTGGPPGAVGPRAHRPHPHGPPHGHAPDEIELREVVDVLRRNAWLIAAAVVLAVVGAFVLLRYQPEEYRAAAAIRVVDARESMTAGLAGSGMEQMVGRKSDPLMSQIQVLRSRRVAGVVVDREGLRLVPASPELPQSLLAGVVVEDPERADTLELRFGDRGFEVGRAGPSAAYGERVDVDGLWFTVAERPAVEAATLVLLPRHRAIDRLLEELRATAREETDVVDVAYTAHDPRIAARVVNSVVEVYRDVDREAAQDEARRRRAFIEEQLLATDSILAGTQAELSAFRSREEVYSSRERLSAEQTGLMGLEVRREELAAEQRMYERLLGLARRTDGAGQREAVRALVSAPGIAANPVVAELYRKLASYESARDSLTEGEWGSARTNPDVARLDLLMDRTQRDILDAAGSHVASLGARVEALDELRARNAETMRALPETESEEVRLVQRVETIRKMSDQLREEYQKAQIAEAVEAGQVEVLDAAPVPDEPVGSGRPLKLALAAMLGFMVGSGAAFLRENMDTAIRRKDDVERVLGLSPLGVVPRLYAVGHGASWTLPGLARRKNGAAVATAGRELVALHDQRSTGAEAYRTLRTNLLFSQLGERLKTVVVTSSLEGEGKTTAAANLATTFAQQGVRVLLVDADLRKARMHAVFGLDPQPGLTEWLMGDVGPESAIRKTEVERLYVLPSGTLPPNPSELLGSPRMRKLVETLRDTFELVIFDSPPLLAAGDAAVLGARADGVVLVVRAGQTDRGAALEAVRQLDTVRARVLGAVLNDPDASVARYGGYYHHDYYGETV